MGAHPDIDADKWPEQGRMLHSRASVCFHFDSSRQVGGTIVRDDCTDPGVLIIRLDDGRHVLATECMYSPRDEQAPARRICSACGHEGVKGSAQVEPSEVGTWPVAGDVDDGVYRKSDVAACSICGAVTVTYRRVSDPTDDDRAWAALLQPEVLAGVAELVQTHGETLGVER